MSFSRSCGSLMHRQVSVRGPDVMPACSKTSWPVGHRLCAEHVVQDRRELCRIRSLLRGIVESRIGQEVRRPMPLASAGHSTARARQEPAVIRGAIHVHEHGSWILAVVQPEIEARVAQRGLHRDAAGPDSLGKEPYVRDVGALSGALSPIQRRTIAGIDTTAVAVIAHCPRPARRRSAGIPCQREQAASSPVTAVMSNPGRLASRSFVTVAW